MPQDDEIQLNFGAITIDNSTLKSEGYKFFEGMLYQMGQFKKSPVSVIQTDVVHNEAIKHIAEEISKAKSLIDQALRSANKHLKIKPEAIADAQGLLSVEGDSREIAEQRLKRFYECIGAEIINSAEFVNIELLMEMYFKELSPFESGKDKKNEFPDAIALLSIEQWAEMNEVNVIAVSQDKGWKNYSDDSNRVTVVSTLSEALERFQPHNKVSSIVAEIREDFLLYEKNHLLSKIENSIVESVEVYDLLIEAESQFYFEYEEISVEYKDHEFDLDENGLIEIRIVRIDDDFLVLKIGAKITVNVEVSFDFSARDPVDKDYMSVGGALCKATEIYHSDILLTIYGDFSKDIEDLEVDDVEVLETLKRVRFGEIEPDWRSENEHDAL